MALAKTKALNNAFLHRIVLVTTVRGRKSSTSYFCSHKIHDLCDTLLTETSPTIAEEIVAKFLMTLVRTPHLTCARLAHVVFLMGLTSDDWAGVHSEML